MHAIIHRGNHSRFPDPEPRQAFRTPHYDCVDLPAALKLIIYVPGVEAGDVEIRAHGPDLVVTARKTRHVRVNWQALHLENVQRHYRLRLRLGSGLDFGALQTSIVRGVLTIVLPKMRPGHASPADRHRRVA